MFNHRFGSMMGLCLICVLLFPGCAKEKLTPINYTVTSTDANSAIRLFNFTNTTADIAVNNIPLTNYTSGQATALGLQLFPSGVWTNTDGGSPFTIPTSLVDKQGKVHLIITPRNSQATSNFTYPVIDTTLLNDPLNPRDYYVLSDGTLNSISKSTAMPAQPDHFKIRIINLATKDSTGMFGPVSLTYANGQQVNVATSNVLQNTTSQYVELPLGAYQFKLFVNGDFTKQLPELPLKPNFYGWNQNIAAQPKQQEALFPKIRTFKAGGTYSIVITKAIIVQLYTSPGGPTFTWYQPANVYRVITEQAAPTNLTYACMDGVNALRSSVVNISVDGQTLGSNIGFGKSVEHGIYVYGTHHVKATDQKGNTVAEKDITMYANDYLTAWVYLNPAGKPDIAFSSTDMTSSFYQSNLTSGTLTGTTIIPDDGTNGALRIKASDYNWQARFLNLSEDLPYLTVGHDGYDYNSGQAGGYAMLFTDYNGIYSKILDSTNYTTATINLARGFTAAADPFLMYQANSNNFWSTDGNGTPYVNNPNYYATNNTNGNHSINLSVAGNNIIGFQSNPGPPAVIPGALLLNVNGLAWSGFIANRSMYSTAAYTPVMEPGYYSVALVGKVSDAQNGQPQFIYIKHNK